jgi:hypothetical protein
MAALEQKVDANDRARHVLALLSAMPDEELLALDARIAEAKVRGHTAATPGHSEKIYNEGDMLGYVNRLVLEGPCHPKCSVKWRATLVHENIDTREKTTEVLTRVAESSDRFFFSGRKGLEISSRALQPYKNEFALRHAVLLSEWAKACSGCVE